MARSVPSRKSASTARSPSSPNCSRRAKGSGTPGPSAAAAPVTSRGLNVRLPRFTGAAGVSSTALSAVSEGTPSGGGVAVAGMRIAPATRRASAGSRSSSAAIARSARANSSGLSVSPDSDELSACAVTFAVAGRRFSAALRDCLLAMFVTHPVSGVAPLATVGMGGRQLLHLAGQFGIGHAAAAVGREAQHALVGAVRLLQIKVLGNARLQQPPFELLLQQAPGFA